MTQLPRSLKIRNTFSENVTCLEKRLMLAGDVAACVSQAATAEPSQTAAHVTAGISADARLAVRDVVFIDASLDNIDSWSRSIPSSAELVLIDSNSDAIDQMTRVLASRCGVCAVHVISHGSKGVLQLGSNPIDIDVLRARGEQLRTWQSALMKGADLLVYGCDVASEAVGQEFLREFARWTGGDVAGSIDSTGATARNGDWDLEFHVGSIESNLVVSNSWREEYSSVLSRSRHENNGDARNRSSRYDSGHNGSSLSDTQIDSDSRESTMGYYRSIDGSFNNLQNPDWGTVGSNLLRVGPASYSDGIETPAGEDRPSAREVSNAISAQKQTEFRNDNDLSAFVYVWGQFIDHDLDLTEPPKENGDPFPIPVPAGDPFFDVFGTGEESIGLTRSAFDEATGGDTGLPREHLNVITTWIDGSMVYGSTEAQNQLLREFSGGRMLESEGGFLPTSDDGSFLAGDIRFGENVNLTAMHTMWVREHNHWAAVLEQDFPEWNDEQLFQESRAIVIAEIQAITMNEFLPALLGDDAIAGYAGYDWTIDPAIATEFSTAGFRIGHTLLNDEVFFMSDDGQFLQEPMLLADVFMQPQLVADFGVDASIKAAASIQAETIDTQVIDSVRNFLFGQPGSGGFDLVSLNIQRGRDHGLADYNTTRQAYGLERVNDFADITSDAELQRTLADVYGSVDNIDLWVGALAEDHLPGAAVGELHQSMFVDQFLRLRDGDRFWYENLFAGEQLDDLRATKLVDVIRRTTDLDNLQDNVFHMRSVIEGEVAGAGAGVEVLVRDAAGEEVGRVFTNENGYYQFGSISRVGNYTVQLAANPEAASASAKITRGDEWVWASILPSELV